MMKLGKRAPRIDRRTFRLERYLPVVLPTPPGHVNWLSKPNASGWPMYMNDKVGDCVCAAPGHMVEQWTSYTIPPPVGPVILPDSAILTMYEQVGGYVVGNPSTDNGCDMLSALKWWRTTGLGGHHIQAFAALSPQNPTLVKSAIQLFGNVYLGIALPLSAQGQNVWQVPQSGPFGDGSPGSWGLHCVPIVSYDATGLMVITWGQKLFMTWGFLHTYADEAYAVLSPDWIEQSGISPGRFNLAQLQADLGAL